MHNLAGHSIVVVDDDTSFFPVYESVLEKYDCSLSLFLSASAALKELSTGPTPTLLIVDHLLTEMSGQDFLEELKTLRADIFEKTFILGFSGSNASSQLLDSFKNWIHAYAQKPNDLSVLMALMKQYTDKCGISLKTRRS